jgi:uncharacterized protein (DUF983 family)
VGRTLGANRMLAGSACGKRRRGRPLNSVVRQRMGAACPKCQGALGWSQLRGEFACPHCNTPLTANTTRAFVVFIILWIIADIPVRFIVFETFGYDGAIAFAARVIASGAIGWFIAYLVVGNLSTVAVRAGP